MKQNNSRDFKKLKNNLITLYKTLCNSYVLKNETTKLSQCKIESLLVLTHAEFEYYIEQRLIKIIDNCISSYNSKKIINEYLANVVASVCITQNIKKITPYPQLANYACKQYKQTIKNNNGIKERNLTLLLKEIGINLSEIIGETELAELDSFGEIRGKIVHSSFSIINLLNLSDTNSKIERIYKIFDIIDKSI